MKSPAPAPSSNDHEEQLRNRLTAVALITMVLTASALAFISAFGHFAHSDYEVSETLIAMFVAATLALAGARSIDRVLRK